MPDPHTYHEQELLARIAKGDKAAFASVYEQHFDGLFFYARRLVGLAAAGDVVSELFLKLYQSGKVFETMSHLTNWLRLSLRNSCLNILRNEKRLRERLEIFAATQSQEEEFLDAEIEAGLYGLLLDALARLPAQQHRILTMSFIEGKDNSSIATELNIALKSVRNQKSIGLQALRRSFGKDELLQALAWVVAGFSNRI